MSGSPDQKSDTFTTEQLAQFEADISDLTTDKPLYRDRIENGERIPVSLAEQLGDEERARTGL